MTAVSRTWVTANVCGNPRRPFREVRRRIARAAEVGGRDAVVCGQEISPGNLTAGKPAKGWPRRYSRIWRRIMRNHGRVTFQGVTEIPISVPSRSDWHRIRSARLMIHRGLARVSPARFLAMLEEVHTPTGIRVVTINLHPVSKPRRGASRAEWRIAKWNLFERSVARQIAAGRRRGASVVTLGDWNKAKLGTIATGQHEVHHRGLDHVLVFPAAGVTVQVVDREAVPPSGGMDHPILATTLRFTR